MISRHIDTTFHISDKLCQNFIKICHQKTVFENRTLVHAKTQKNEICASVEKLNKEIKYP